MPHLFRFVAMGIAKTLSKVFGIATMAFFGRMPSRDDDKIALVGVASLTWLPIVVAVFWPALAEIVIPFAPDDEELTRWIAIGLAVIVPPAVGLTVSRMQNNRGRGARHTAKQIAMGLPYTVIIGVVIASVVVVVPLLKASYLVRRFEVMRVMVMIEKGVYDGTVDHLVACLQEHGIEVSVEEPRRVIRVLFRALGWVLGQIFHRDVADEMKTLRPADPDADWFEVTLHAADMTIVGSEEVACRLHAILADALDERVLYLTWDDDSQALEDDIRRLRTALDDGEEVDPDEVAGLADRLADLHLDKEEWNAVRRLVYRLERDVARTREQQAVQAR